MNESTFHQAVLITSAFIQNGDIRCGGATNPNSMAMSQVHDMIVTTYRAISNAHRELEKDSNSAD